MAKKQQLNILETEVGEAVKSSELFGKMQYAEEISIGNGSRDLVYYSDTKTIVIELKTKGAENESQLPTHLRAWACTAPVVTAGRLMYDWVVDLHPAFQVRNAPSKGILNEEGCLLFRAILIAAFQSASRIVPFLQ